MNPHPATIEYIRAACRRPEMYMTDFDLRQLEMQLHGFDAALAAVGALGGHERFNEDFTNFVVEEVGVSGSQGWAAALVLRFGSAGRSRRPFTFASRQPVAAKRSAWVAADPSESPCSAGTRLS
jgi:hypothetical protein